MVKVLRGHTQTGLSWEEITFGLKSEKYNGIKYGNSWGDGLSRQGEHDRRLKKWKYKVKKGKMTLDKMGKTYRGW